VTTPIDDGGTDFFISYTSPDRRWAEWIAWQLEEAGYSVIVQAWDFVAGRNFVHEMQMAAQRARRTIAVLTPAYLVAPFPAAEWEAAFRDDPTGAERKLVPVRVERCQPDGILASIVWVDLLGLDEEAARERLLAGMRDRAKPSEPPSFPGHAATSPPAFPVTDGDGDNAATPPVSAPAVTLATPSGVPARLASLFFVADAVDERQGRVTVTITGDRNLVRALDALASQSYGRRRVRLAYGDRVLEGDLAPTERSVAGAATRLIVQLERVEEVRGETMRAGTSGYSPDDLVELGIRHLFFGDPLPDALGILKHMTDPRIDPAELERATRDQYPADAVRLLLLETLVAKGNASTITEFQLGPEQDGGRHLLLEWEEPLAYTNVAPQRRRVEGMWRV